MTYKAVDVIDTHSFKSERDDKEIITNILAKASVNVNPDSLIDKLLHNCDVALNFHPDRISNNSKLIMRILPRQLGIAQQLTMTRLEKCKRKQQLRGICLRE